MFEKLFVKTSDLVFHTIAPYADERERFLVHCGEEGFSKAALSRIAGIVVTTACDLHAHGGLDVDQKRLEAAAARLEVIRRQVGVRDDAREYRKEFLRVTTRWVLFLGRLQPQAIRQRPYGALLDDFERWMTEERGLSRGTLKNRRWHIGRFLDWLHERHAPVPGLSPRDLDGYLQHLHANRLSRVSIKIHTNAVRAFSRHAERRGWCAAGLADRQRTGGTFAGARAHKSRRRPGGRNCGSAGSSGQSDSAAVSTHSPRLWVGRGVSHDRATSRRRITARSGACFDGDDRHESYPAEHAVHGGAGVSMNTGLIAMASVTISEE